MEKLIQERLTVGPLQCNCVILGDPVTKEAIVVDPGGDIDLVKFRLAELGLTCKAIVHTHAHLDHVCGTGDLQLATGAPVSLHEGDLPLLQALPMQAQMFHFPKPREVEVDRFLADESVVTAGQLSASVIHTPGHTPGSLCFLVEGGPLIAGDTLFQGSIGRFDLPGADGPTLLRSIREQLLSLPDDYAVYPGHGGATTIGEERMYNPYVGARASQA